MEEDPEDGFRLLRLPDGRGIAFVGLVVLSGAAPAVKILACYAAAAGIVAAIFFAYGWYTWAMPSLVMISLWNGIGGNRMLIFLAGLQAIPETLYEAASS